MGTNRKTPVEWVRQLEGLGPRRLTGTPTERAAQDLLAAELSALGFRTEFRPFTWTRSVYSSLLLHFGLASLATIAGWYVPEAGALLHIVVAISYARETSRRGFVLRHLLPTISSQNLLATLPAKTTMRRRVVLVAHCDAAFTGTLFNPTLIRLSTKPPPPPFRWFGKQLGVATASVFVLGVLEGVSAAGVWSAPWWLRVGLSIPALFAALLNLDVVVRNHVVPGAADNLSGCAGCVELAHRLRGTLDDDVELVIVISGAEEAGTGGAARLAQAMAASNEWDRKNTFVLGLDTLTNGTLRLLEEGELWRIPVPKPIATSVDEENATGTSAPVPLFIIPAGASDALPFLSFGYDAATLTCIDPIIGAPRHYHRPTDCADNLDPVQLDASIDYAERFIRRLQRA